MREHQIVITLKPEQFLEVQRLARAANAKSMGIFVRQQLLAALGIDGAAPAAGAASSVASQNIEPVVTELRRLHGELKMFVAESLSLYSGELTPTEPVETISADGSLAVSAATATVSTGGLTAASTAQVSGAGWEAAAGSNSSGSVFVRPEDELEQAARKAFSISPRLGAIGEVGAVSPAQPTGQQQVDRVRDMISRHDQRRDGHHVHHPVPNQQLDQPFLEPADPIDPLQRLLADDTPRRPGVTVQQPAAAAAAQPAAQPSVNSAATPMPVSFGAFDPESSQEQEGQETFDDDEITPSLAERHRQLLQNDEMQDGFGEAEDETGAGSATQARPVPPFEESNIKPNTGSPLGIPPFSGSPPPKRRQV